MIPNRYFTSSVSSLDLGRMIRPFVRNCLGRSQTSAPTFRMSASGIDRFGNRRSASGPHLRKPIAYGFSLRPMVAEGELRWVSHNMILPRWADRHGTLAGKSASRSP